MPFFEGILIDWTIIATIAIPNLLVTSAVNSRIRLDDYLKAIQAQVSVKTDPEQHLGLASGRSLMLVVFSEPPISTRLLASHSASAAYRMVFSALAGLLVPGMVWLNQVQQ
jgi:hypothetical protein